MATRILISTHLSMIKRVGWSYGEDEGVTETTIDSARHMGEQGNGGKGAVGWRKGKRRGRQRKKRKKR